MRDKFLYKLRPPLDKAFSRNLYQRLSLQYPDDLELKKEYQTMKRKQQFRGWKYAFLSMCVMAVLLITLSEPVRAKALEWIRVIAGFTVEETLESPIVTIDEAIITPESIPGVSIADIMQDPPFNFNLPTWIPEGFVMDPQAGIANSKDWVSISWTNAGLSEIQLMVEREYTGYSIPAGEGSSEPVEIDGTPALLVRGAWNTSHAWDMSLGITIAWEEDGHFYRLIYSEHEPVHNELKSIERNGEELVNELTQMAESIH